MYLGTDTDFLIFKAQCKDQQLLFKIQTIVKELP